MAKSVLRSTIHTSVAKSILNEIGSRAVKYYFSYGRTHDWGGVNVQDASDTLPYELAARKNSVFVKEVTPGDACLVIPRYNWVSGAVYDHYDAYSTDNISYSGAKSIEEALYYVITDELNVYKCLDNNNNSASLIKPTGTSTTEITTTDGYVWKYLYTIPTSLGNKFLSTTLMPVANAVTKMFYSDGKLEKFVLANKGSGYIGNYQQEGTVSSDTGANLDYRKIFGVNTNFLGRSRTITEVVSTGIDVTTATIQATPLTVNNFVGNGTGVVIANVDSTDALAQDDYINVTGAAAQQIINVTQVEGNGSVNVVITTDTDITDLQEGEHIVITGATGVQPAKLNGTWSVVSKTTTTISIAINTAMATGVYVSGSGIDLGTTYIPSRTNLNGTWRITRILSGTTFSFNIATGNTLIPATYKSGLGTIQYSSKYDLLREGDYITIAGATGTEEEKLNGSHQVISVSGIKVITFAVSSPLDAGTYTTNLGTAKHSSKITGLIPNDYIEVNGQVRQISSIESDTELTLKSTGPLLYVGQDSILTKLNTYLEIVDGDGFVEENPYIVTGVSVVDAGTQYSTNTESNPTNTTIEFSAPQLALGRVAQGTVTVVDGAITGIVLTDPGYGYTARPSAVIYDNTPGGLGAGAVVQVNIEKSVAFLAPVVSIETGEIMNVVPKVTGIGYTYGTITPRRYNSMALPSYLDAWVDAIISADFNLGKLDTKQADVELSAINGGIHYIKVTTAGVGYVQGEGTVTVTGDGVGCTAIPSFNNLGILDRIIITNPGKDYTYADVAIAKGASTSTEAVARAIITPSGGHGKSAVDELNGRTLSMFSRLTADMKLKGLPLTDVNYRQLLLYRQPSIFGSNNLLNSSIGSACYKLILTPKDAAPALSTIPLNSVLVASESVGGATQIRLRLVARTTTEVLLQAIDNNDEQLNTSLVLIHSNGTNTYTINSVEKPDVEKLSGDIIYIDNRQEFKPLEDQTVSISSRFRF